MTKDQMREELVAKFGTGEQAIDNEAFDWVYTLGKNSGYFSIQNNFLACMQFAKDTLEDLRQGRSKKF